MKQLRVKSISALVLGALPLVAPLTNVHAVEGPAVVRVSGFVDPQLQITSSGNTVSKGFVLNDGALYVDGSVESTEFKIDIPLRMFSTGNVDFDIAKTRAQAYASAKYSNGLKWKLGQFDTTFGFEGNDTVDIAFTRQGIVYTFTDPFVHTGLLVGYEMGEMSFNLYATNPNDSGILPSGTKPSDPFANPVTNNGMQYGAQFVYTSPELRGSLGGLTFMNGKSNMSDIYYDVTLGVTIDAFSMDAEISYNKVGANATASYGYLLQLMYTGPEGLSFGARGEIVNDRSQRESRMYDQLGAVSKQSLLFVGPQYAVNSALKLKLDYTYQSVVATEGAVSVPEHGLNVAAVYRF
jgi:hypothetical protein